jgi:hypothetical protein
MMPGEGQINEARPYLTGQSRLLRARDVLVRAAQLHDVLEVDHRDELERERKAAVLVRRLVVALRAGNFARRVERRLECELLAFISALYMW